MGFRPHQRLHRNAEACRLMLDRLGYGRPYEGIIFAIELTSEPGDDRGPAMLAAVRDWIEETRPKTHPTPR